MTNLFQENKEMISHRTNSTTCPDLAGFGFLPKHKIPTLKKPKSLSRFFSGSYFLPTLTSTDK